MVQLREAHRARIGGEAAMYLAIRAVQLDQRRPEMAAVGEAVAEEHRLRKRRVLGQGGHGRQRQRGGQESAKRLAGRHADLRCLGCRAGGYAAGWRSDEHTSELQSLMRISYAVFCLINTNRKEDN